MHATRTRSMDSTGTICRMMRLILDFWIPTAMVILLAVGMLFSAAWVVAIAGGIVIILLDAVAKIRQHNFSLDYIAFLALLVSLATHNWGAGAIVALMFSGGKALETYAAERAERSLRALVESIPKEATVKEKDGTVHEMPLTKILHGMVIVVKHMELVPLDGTLLSPTAVLNEANLTGEPLPSSRTTGSFIKSGCINEGEAFELSVVGTLSTSAYMRIVTLVQEAKRRPAKLVRFAERANFPFTAITLVIAGIAYAVSDDITRALAVLVIATPCPLIIAAPVAFIGGMSHAARHRIIVKSPAALETIARARTILFDKTGTLTLGTPRLIETILTDPGIDASRALSLASAIEFHSLHPLARALGAARELQRLPLLPAQDVEEKIGQGIEGTVDGLRLSIKAAPSDDRGGIMLSLADATHELARFRFEDVLKEDTASLLAWLAKHGFHVEVLTGDTQENAERTLGRFNIPIRARATPQNKSDAVDLARMQGPVIMVGDGLNDAPALAHADVGIVFSGTENSAAIDAAHVAILGRDVGLIRELIEDARRTTQIAEESTWGGIVLSVVGMVFAAAGDLRPVAGAIVQEGIDVAVIMNALRAALRDENSSLS